MGVFVYLCVNLSVWMCLSVSEEKKDEEKRSLRLSSFCTQRIERKKVRNYEINKIIVCTATITVYIEKGASFTHFRQKNTHISGCKDV